MAKYRKTALIEAHMFGDPDMPQEFVNAICFRDDLGNGPAKPHIHTLEGPHLIGITDWVAKGVKGEFWPIKDDIFRATYEAVAQLLNALHDPVRVVGNVKVKGVMPVKRRLTPNTEATDHSECADHHIHEGTLCSPPSPPEPTR